MGATAPELQTEHLVDFASINARLHYRGGRLVAREDGFELRTVLQPVFSVRHQRPVGCEALIRGRDDEGREVPAWRVLERGTAAGEVEMNRLCAALHVRNFTAIAGRPSWLFLNISASEFNLGTWGDRFFSELLASSGLPPSQVVVEIVESPVSSDVDLGAVIDELRRLGVLVALDDFGAGHSNFERIWQLKPDIVKLDRSFIALADRNRAIYRSLPSIVDILHQQGCLVVAEGIETERQALSAMNAGVDLVQGHYFARTFEVSGRFFHHRIDWARLQDGLHDTLGSGTLVTRQNLIAHLARMYGVVEQYRELGGFGDRVQRLFELSGVIRCYAIDGSGLQTSENVESPRLSTTKDPRLAPMAAAEGASWYSRPYFRRAKQYPGEIQISREYLSCADAAMCITLSVLVDTPRGQTVLCCDLLAE